MPRRVGGGRGAILRLLSRPTRPLRSPALPTQPRRWSTFGLPVPRVDVDEESQRDPSSPLVAVRQGMVSGKSDNQHRGFVDEVRIELGVAEAGGGRAVPSRQDRDS